MTNSEYSRAKDVIGYWRGKMRLMPNKSLQCVFDSAVDAETAREVVRQQLRPSPIQKTFYGWMFVIF